MGLIINTLKHPVLISYLSGANNYSFVHFRTGEQVLISKSLRFLEKQLPYFIRIHKTLLINPECVKKLQHQPHSKTGGAVVLDDGTILPVSRRQWPVLVQSVWTTDVPTIEPERSVAFVSGDYTKSLLLRQLIDDQWPLTLLHVMENGAFLSQLLIMAETERPVLLLIDVRQAVPSRLTLLRELKETPRLRRLPVVLLISPNTGFARSGYAMHANSVVVMPDDNGEFVDVMEQVCRYWLTMASLPVV
ncbi:response regulator transcription factor [Fibrella forsythiae]|uniref:LytTR family transcriptional regulator DNA-binding domain-containing protein n=1 Tax=Fibrella forsythiae TaxID=2817061 RepID=A0ABS3JIA3_9BACT|nr:LytTR family transcriptional regulator DNA-binding domain-containing protein [Fibrella forsythiae]MBO0949733.1 LytTR family transcriptional regulator DNA-binding domain-containing protein [Fibrella forsythiae]